MKKDNHDTTSFLVILLLIVGLIVFAFLTLPAESHALDYDQENRNLGESDASHVVHVVGGATIGGLVVYYLTDEDDSIMKKVFCGVGAALVGGLCVELLDKNIDAQDIAEWGLGGAVGVTLISIDF